MNRTFLLNFLVLYLVRGTSSVTDKIVHEGDVNVPLNCPGFVPIDPIPQPPEVYVLNWFLHKSVGERSHIARYAVLPTGVTGPEVMNELIGKAEYSDTGIITIYSIEISNEGLYECDFGPTTIAKENVSLVVNVKPKEEDLTISDDTGGNAIVENTKVTFTCTLARIKPLPKHFVWRYAGSEGVTDSDFTHSDHENGGFTVRSDITLNITANLHNSRLSCTVTPDGEGEPVSTERTLQIESFPDPPSDGPPIPIIAGVVGGVVVIILIIVIVVFLRRRKPSKEKDRDLSSADQGLPLTETGEAQQGPVYAQVNKPKKGPQKPPRTYENGAPGADPVYAEPDQRQTNGVPAPGEYSNFQNNNLAYPGKSVAPDGTVYTEVAFKDDPKQQKKKPTPKKKKVPTATLR